MFSPVSWGDVMGLTADELAIFAKLLVHDWRHVYRLERDTVVRYGAEVIHTKRASDVDIVRRQARYYMDNPAYLRLFIRRNGYLAEHSDKISQVLAKLTAWCDRVAPMAS